MARLQASLRDRRLRLGIGLALALIVLGAVGFRLAGRDWDQDQHLNVDEYFITKATTRTHLPATLTIGALFDPQHSPLDPRAGGTLYPYGTLPLYLTRGITTGLAALSGNAGFTSFDNTLQAGRILAGLLDTLTLLCVVGLAARLWGAGAGLAAGALYALAILPLHTSHFYISDAFMTAFLTVSLLGSVAFLQGGRPGWIALAGLSIGLAMACKLTAAPTLLVPLAAVVGRGLGVGDAPDRPAPLPGAGRGETAGDGPKPSLQGGEGRVRGESRLTATASRGDTPPSPHPLPPGERVGAPASATPPGLNIAAGHGGREGTKARGIVLLGLLVVGLAALGLLIGDPFGVIDWPTYLAQVRDQAAIQSGADDQWFTRKYVGTWPLLYPWGQIMLLGVGPLVGLAGTLGLGVVAVRAWRGRRGAEALLLLGAAIYFASVGFLEAKWLRYFLPLVPYLCLFAVQPFFYRGDAETRRISDCGRLVQDRRFSVSPRLCGVLLAGLLVSALLGALAFTAIYRADHTQVQASRWIFAHIPPGSRLGTEVTTTELPLPLPGAPPPAQYRLVRMDPLADQPSAQAAAALRNALAQADYLVVDSTQAALTVPRLPWRYPVQIRYYDLLFAGRLGYAPVFTATSYPAILGLTIPDDGGWVDPSFMDSSHPPIHIFQKTRALSAAEWDALFADAVRQPSVATRHAP